MSHLTLARPYAKAAYLYAKEKGEVEPWFDFLGELGLLFASRKMLSLLKNPKLQVSILLDVLFHQLQHQPNANMRHYLQVLAENKRLDCLPDIVALFARDWQHDRAVREVEVISTEALSKTQLSDLETALTKRFNQRIFIHASVDPLLIGGVMIRSNDYVMDGSLLGQLKRLKHTLMQ